MNLYDIEVSGIDGQRHRLSEFAGKALLVVNVASKCGYTPQYQGLEALHRQYAGRGFAVLGFPCDQFGHQEPGDEAEIQRFGRTNYDVTFPLFAKIQVNGAEAHPLYQHLKKVAPGILGTEAIKWNFTKFLIDSSGQVVGRYAPGTTPASLTKEIEAVLPR